MSQFPMHVFTLGYWLRKSSRMDGTGTLRMWSSALPPKYALHENTLKFVRCLELFRWRSDSHLPKGRLTHRRWAISLVWKKIVQSVEIELGFGAIQKILRALHISSAILQFFSA